MLQYKNRLDRQLELNVDGVHAVPNTFSPKLLLRVSARNEFGYPISVFGIEGGLSLRTPSGEIFLGNLYRVSGSTPPYPLEFSQLSERQDQLVIDLDWRMLHEIESRRNGGDLKFVGTLQFLCGGLSETNELKSMFWLQVKVVRNRSSEVVVPQREWIEALNRWGYADVRVLEVSVPAKTEAKIAFTSALAYLSSADQQFFAGNYPDTMTACRKAADCARDTILDYLKSLEGDKDHSLRRDNTEKLYKAICGFLSIGPHKGHPATRPEAALALSMCKDFLSFASKLEISQAQVEKSAV
jgi:hypothetical protein